MRGGRRRAEHLLLQGADIDNILYFTKIYPDTKVFKLEQNYRSTQTIVRAANSLIEKNERQIPKEVFSEKERGEAIGVFQAYSDVEEGDIVTNKIAQLRREHDYEYSDFAILYRTNAQSRVFEEALRKRGMPYKIYGGLSFYQRKEIKDIIAYFRLVVNPTTKRRSSGLSIIRHAALAIPRWARLLLPPPITMSASGPHSANPLRTGFPSIKAHIPNCRIFVR